MIGWGGSDPVPFDERDNTEALNLFVDALGLERAAFVGNSLGAMISLRMAVHHPDKVSHVINHGLRLGRHQVLRAGRRALRRHEGALRRLPRPLARVDAPARRGDDLRLEVRRR